MSNLLPCCLSLLASLLLLPACVTAEPEASTTPAELERYNVVWSTPSEASKDSMPLSGGILGLNVWVEKGEVCFLIGSPNCMDEDGMQVKLGLVRLHLAQPIASDFKQELRLAQSEIVISGKASSGAPLSVKLWCDVDSPVVHVELGSGEAQEISATYETWSNYEAKIVAGSLVWSRRLAKVNARRQHDLQAQGMTEFADKVPDPLSGLTCGGRIDGPGLVAAGNGVGKFNGMDTKTATVKTATSAKHLDLCLTLRMEQDPSLVAWEAALASDAHRALAAAVADHSAALKWWQDFWNRSSIIINSGAGDGDPAWSAGRKYQLIRYLYASNIKGRAMSLFNGASFPCTGNPDKREWESCQFMAQNQRLSSWPMLRSGDFDILQVATDFYRDRIDMSRAHAKKFWGVDGVAWCEAFSIFGLGAIGTNADGRCNPPHLEHHYTSGMEFALLMLELQRYSGKNQPHYPDAAMGIIRYYDQFHQQAQARKTGQPLDDNGRLVIYPSDACEPYHGCTNNTDVIAGLHALTRELLALPDGRLTAAEHAYLASFQKRIPTFPIREKNGRKFYAAAASWEWVMQNENMDFPQMYVLFPFTTMALGRDDMELAKNTFELSPINNKVQQQNHAWYQTLINFARMGETAQAQAYLLDKMHHSSARFPTFYQTFYINGSPNFNHMPDMDHCGTAMLGLQEMLMQTDGKRILLGPAWPAEWNVNFKLHAPWQTVVEGHVAAGKLVVDRVTPASRRSDIEIFPLKTAPPPPLSQGKAASASSVWDDNYAAAKAFDGKPETRWAAGKGTGKEAWLAIDLGAEQEISRAVIIEASYPRVSKFSIEAQQPDGSWKEVATGSEIGSSTELKFAAVKARQFRLHILDAKEDAPTIDEVQLFAP